MATLTVVVGYCGSGKSWWLEQRRRERPDAYFMEEGAQVFPGASLHDGVASALRAGKDCFVGLMDCVPEAHRIVLTASLGQKAPGTTIKWVFYENDVAKANRNVCRDAARVRDEGGNIQQNLRWSQFYSIPAEAELLTMHVLPDRRRPRRLTLKLTPIVQGQAMFTIASLREGDHDASYLLAAIPEVADLAALRAGLAELTGDEVEVN